MIKYFTLKENRSERAKQVEILVPALNNKEIRFQLLKDIDGLDKEESDNSIVLHFVWVLRDAFSFERDQICDDKEKWNPFIEKWVKILDLEPWANDPKWWICEIGKKKIPGVVHPCQKTIGWSEVNLKNKTTDEVIFNELTRKRKVINTECDCFIQTSKRLIIIECKDKTSPKNEQRARHDELVKALKILLPREKEPEYIELTDQGKGVWTWKGIEKMLSSF